MRNVAMTHSSALKLVKAFVTVQTGFYLLLEACKMPGVVKKDHKSLLDIRLPS